MIILIFIISLSGCQGTLNKQSAIDTSSDKDGSFPVTVTDDLGRKVTLETEPQRIVSLAPSNTEILFFLGLGDRVVGDTKYCDYPEEAKLLTKVGGFDDPSLEIVVSLKPDLVVATDRHQQMIKGLEDAGLKVVVLSSNSMEGIFNNIRLVGRAAGVEKTANDLTKGLQDRVDKVSQKIGEIPENQRPTVYYEMWYQPFMSVGKESLIGQIIETAGGTSITDDFAEEYPQISEEVIVEKNPEVMIHSYGHGEDISSDEITARKGWNGISFVKNNRIYSIESDLLTLPGPRIVDGLEKMAECLYPEKFKSTSSGS